MPYHRQVLPNMFDREIVLDYRLRWLGLVPASCFVFHAIYNLFIVNRPGNLLWMCHVTTLLLAVGSLAPWRRSSGL